MPNSSFLKKQLWYYLTYRWEDKGVYNFPKGIYPKVNVIARLEFELSYDDSSVPGFNHHSTRTPPILSVVLFPIWKYFGELITTSLSLSQVQSLPEC